MVTISSLVGFTMIVSVPGKHRSDSRQAKKGNAPSKPPNPKGQNRKSSGSLTRLLIGSVTAPALTEHRPVEAVLDPVGDSIDVGGPRD